MSFVDWRSFKTNKRVILFCRELVSRSRNLNQSKVSNRGVLTLPGSPYVGALSLSTSCKTSLSLAFPQGVHFTLV